MLVASMILFVGASPLATNSQSGKKGHCVSTPLNDFPRIIFSLCTSRVVRISGEILNATVTLTNIGSEAVQVSLWRADLHIVNVHGELTLDSSRTLACFRPDLLPCPWLNPGESWTGQIFWRASAPPGLRLIMSSTILCQWRISCTETVTEAPVLLVIVSGPRNI